MNNHNDFQSFYIKTNKYFSFLEKKSFCENFAIKKIFVNIFAYFCILFAPEKCEDSLRSVTRKNAKFLRNFASICSAKNAKFSRKNTEFAFCIFAKKCRFFSKFRIVFEFFPNIHFRENVCKIQTKISHFYVKRFVCCKPYNKRVPFREN